ncbi:GCN5-related N-acetyltransferase [Kribbella flavida DSM 17836]|uniref:GCN5-related N-acetyltransferase n=1 Tax=Kribbella flavida (strain DSM 17836 / JCM 10339 / NBRC 14399) TaxID=479435 RepID=D2PTJ3_KRIFD|nr:GNAT family N-acetyltransferase [Kribbella flavida]ADB31306.1 GCN5-related N-acetyltransferase [Kribbella flavida DSM 17836]
MEIRPAEPADIESAVAMHDRVVPFFAVTATGLRHRLQGGQAPPPGSGTFVAAEGGRVVGWATTGLIAGSVPLDGQLRLVVDPDFRGQGIGTELLELAHGTLKAAGAVSARVFADPASVEWAARWGYRQTREVYYVGMDPRDAPPRPPVPEGLRLSALDRLDPHQVYEADEVAQRTKPGDARIAARPYDEWLAGTWKAPGLRLDLSVAALDGDRVVGFTLGNGDDRLLWSQMTATMPDQRGRGLAKLVKCEALHRAAAADITRMYTANYVGNEPMIAVNRWLGYSILARHAVLICPL